MSDLQKLDFMNICLKMYVALVTKLQERCPLKHLFLWSLSAFNPSQMVEYPASSSTALQTITSKLVSVKQQKPDEGDVAEKQYKRLLREEKVKLEKFNSNVHRLDEIYHDLLHGKPEYRGPGRGVPVSH